MSSIIVPLLSRVELNGSFLGNGATQTFTLPTINVLPFHYATLILRLHEATWNSGAYFRVEGFDSFPSSEDAREFVMTSARLTATALQSVATVPYVTTAAVSDPENQPPAYQFQATLRMSTTAASLFVVVSADLLLRSKEQCYSSMSEAAKGRESCGCGPPSGGSPDLEFSVSPDETLSLVARGGAFRARSWGRTSKLER